jgi:hypothetical protein
MALPLLGLLTGPIINAVSSIISETVTDKDKANELKAQVAARIKELEMTELKGAVQIITAEASGNWLQKSWRPLLMLTIVAIVANNYLFAPYLVAFGVTAPVLELPDSLFNLMTLGVGGYIAGRSIEKTAEVWKKGN